MDSPIRKQQKEKEYQRHKLLRKIKKRQQRKAEQMQKIAEKQLKRKLPKMDDGTEPYYGLIYDWYNNIFQNKV